MELLRLTLTNFRRHRRTDLPLGRGLTAIIGQNGDGKSTIIEAIVWALFGTAAIRGKVESIRYRGAKPRSRVVVELQFRFLGHEYRVARSLHHAELFLDDGNEPIVAGRDAVTAHIERTLGMTHIEFVNTYVTLQKELKFLGAHRGVARGRFISRVLGHDRLRLAQEATRGTRNKLAAAIEAGRRALGDPEALEQQLAQAATAVETARFNVRAASAELATRRAALRGHEPAVEALRDARDRDATLESAIAAASLKKAEAEREIGRIEGELARVREIEARFRERSEQAARLPAALAELDRWEQRRAQDERRREIQTEIQQLEKQLASSADRFGRLSQAPTLLIQFAEKLAGLRRERQELDVAIERDRAHWIEERQAAAEQLAVARARISDLESHVRHILEAGPAGDCALCKRELGDDFDAVRSETEDDLANVRATVPALEAKALALREQPANLTRALSELAKLDRSVAEATEKHTRCEEAVPQFEALQAERSTAELRIEQLREEAASLRDSYQAADHEAAKQLVDRLRQAEAEINWLEKASARRAEWEAEQSAARTRQGSVALEMETLRAERSALAFSPEALRSAERELVRLQNAEREAEVALARAETAANAAEEAVQSAESAVANAKKRLAEITDLEIEYLHYDELDTAFTQLRDNLNDRIRPDLSEIASALLAELTDGRYSGVELTADYDVVVLKDGVECEVVSGGEEDLLNLSLRIAISQMIADRAGAPLSLLIMDEVFGSLDDSRRAAVVDVLRTLVNRFPQILVITHIAAIRDAMDNFVRVTMDERTEAATAEMVVAEDDEVDDLTISAGEEDPFGEAQSGILATAGL